MFVGPKKASIVVLLQHSATHHTHTHTPACALVYILSYWHKPCGSSFRMQLIDLFPSGVSCTSCASTVVGCLPAAQSTPPPSRLHRWSAIKQAGDVPVLFLHDAEICEIINTAGGCWRYERKEARSDADKKGEIRLSQQERGFIFDEYEKEDKVLGDRMKEARKCFASYLISTFLMAEMKERQERRNVCETVESLSGFWRGVWFVQKERSVDRKSVV